MPCENVFWVNNIKELVCDFSVIPTASDNLATSMNKITRLALVLSIVLMFLSVKSGIVVMVLSFILIISIYYSSAERAAPSIENYSDDEEITVIPSPFNLQTSGRFCNDCDASAPNDPDYISKNQLLLGFGNPKTRIPPIVAPPSHELEAWADSGLTKRNQINKKKNFDLYRSGYQTQESYSQPRKCQECMYSPCMCSFGDGTYKDRVLTQTIQPGVYQKSMAGEPINTMVGISYQQQFLPTLVEQTPDEIKFTQGNPQGNWDHNTDYSRIDLTQNYSNIYDPRLTGYGASDRTYEEPMTGQTRFFYRDIDAIKMPNYITRNNIDNLPWAPTYGPDVPLQDYTEHRQMANNAFHDSALTFRTDMQERLMRKRNAEMWQRRVAPIYTSQKIGLGANRSCL